MHITDLRAVTPALGLALAAALLISPTSYAEPAGPQLSIAVDNGQTSTAAGDTLTYTITVENLGRTRVTGLRVSQTLPTGLELRSADADGAATDESVVWRLDLAATSEATLHTTMRVGQTPPDLLRLATVACAAVSPQRAPIVCATHSDELPAGAAAAAQEGRAVGEDAASSSTDRTVWGLGVAVILVVGAGGLVIRRRRTRED